MDTDELLEMAGDPRFISGIYNYCDRWCERCPFTARCLLYATEQKDPLDPEARDIRNAAFWEHLGKIFERTKEMILKMAKEKGIDLDSPEVQAAAEKRTRHKKTAKERDLTRRAFKYTKTVDTWFKRHKRLFREKGEELQTMADLEIEGLDPVGQAEALQDGVEVIRWYQYQIYVKLQRALSKDDDIDDEDYVEAAHSDANGSAKVALIGLDRSIAAWGQLRDHLPDHADSILDILVHLDRVRRATEQTFPQARAFVRPGFDTGEKP